MSARSYALHSVRAQHSLLCFLHEFFTSVVQIFSSVNVRRMFRRQLANVRAKPSLHVENSARKNDHSVYLRW